jgi:hypothetical protein
VFLQKEIFTFDAMAPPFFSFLFSVRFHVPVPYQLKEVLSSSKTSSFGLKLSSATGSAED